MYTIPIAPTYSWEAHIPLPFPAGAEQALLLPSFNSTIFPLFLCSAQSLLPKQRPKCRMSLAFLSCLSLYEEFSWSPFLEFRLKMEWAERREGKEVTPLQEHAINGPEAHSPTALTHSPPHSLPLQTEEERDLRWWWLLCSMFYY